MDQMISRYTTQRRTLRWPLVMFFSMLDISTLASYLNDYENNKMIKKKNQSAKVVFAPIK